MSQLGKYFWNKKKIEKNFDKIDSKIWQGSSNIGYNVLNNGFFSPIVGISTDKEEVVIEAVKKGIRTFDTSIRCDQAAIGNGIQRGPVIKDNLYKLYIMIHIILLILY